MDSLKLTTFKVGANLFNYDKNEKIFTLAGKPKGHRKLAECYSCIAIKFEKEKEMHFCEFCTRANCKNCMLKTRPYPNA
jgi:hypothetical protein